MADETWRQRLLSEWVAAEADVQAALAAAELPPLRQWLTGEPRPLLTTGGPLLWWHWAADGTDEDSEQLGYQTERVAIMATLLLEAPSGQVLMEREAAYLPVIIGALERRTWTYRTDYQGSEQVLNPLRTLSLTPTVWVVTVDRPWGGEG